MEDFGFSATFWAEACVCPAGLEIGEIGARGDFEPAFLATGPGFEVVLLRMGESDVTGADEEDAVWDFEFLEERLGVLA